MGRMGPVVAQEDEVQHFFASFRDVFSPGLVSKTVDLIYGIRKVRNRCEGWRYGLYDPSW